MDEPRQRAESVAALERVRDELSQRFGHADAPFTPWALELLAIVEAALIAGEADA